MEAAHGARVAHRIVMADAHSFGSLLEPPWPGTQVDTAL